MCNTHQQYIFAYSLTLAILEHVTEYSPNLIKQCMFLSWIKYKLYSITVSSVCLFYSSTITSDVKQLEARFAFFELFTTLAFALCIFFVFFNAHVLSLQKGIKGEKNRKDYLAESTRICSSWQLVVLSLAVHVVSNRKWVAGPRVSGVSLEVGAGPSIPDDAHVGLSQLGPLLALLQLLLRLTELGQVEGGNLLRLLDLLLVGLDLLLQLGCQLGHPVLVLLVLIQLELELLDAALALLVALVVLPGAGLHVAQLNLQLPDAGLQLGHCGPSAAHRQLVGLRQLVLQLNQLGLQRALRLGLSVDMILLGAQLVGQPGRIHHRLLGLLFAVLGLLQHVIDLGVHGVHNALQPALLIARLGVDGVHLVDGAPGLGQLGLCLTLAPLSRVEEGPGLLHLALEGVGPPVG